MGQSIAQICCVEPCIFLLLSVLISGCCACAPVRAVGAAPAPQTPELQLARRAISARLSKLPVGITPQHNSHRNAAACDACGEEVELNGNYLLECDRCRCSMSWYLLAADAPRD